MQTYPFYPRNVGNSFYQLGYGLASIEVYAIESEFLGHDLKLVSALFYKLFDFIKDFFHRSRLMTTGDQWNGAIGASAIATFGDF